MDAKAHRQLALDMARQSIVLLKNGDAASSTPPLPLRNDGEKLAVIGPNAADEPLMWGNYNGVPNHTVTILDGIRQKLKANSKRLTYLKGCDLTDSMVLECLLPQCKADGRKGLKGTFWNNTAMEGKAVTTQHYTTPLAVTTAGMHQFAPGVRIEDFSARYETQYTPTEDGEFVVNVEGCGHFEVYVNGDQKQKVHSWRTTPTRTPVQGVKGQSYTIEVRFQYVKTWGANLKVNIAREHPIDYQAIIAQLQDIQKVIFVGGISAGLEGEEMPVNIEGFKGGDRTNIELPRVQRDFLRALKDAGKTVIFVNCSGSAIALEPETQTCDAILQAWYPGEEGGTAVADILFGDVNPSGKLPVTFYKRTDQLPDYEDYTMRGRTYRYFNDALYPFGYGLSYTTFRIHDAQLTLDAEGKGHLTVKVTNTGHRDATEVVQLYVRNTADPEAPLKTLRAFQRVDVKAGQTAVVTLPLTRETFEFFDADTNTMRTKAGRYELLYGTSSADSALQHLTATLQM